MGKKTKKTKRTPKTYADGFAQGRNYALRQSKRAFEAGFRHPQHNHPLRARRSATGALDSYWRNLLDWARHLDENSDLTVGALTELVDNVVGGGVTMEPMVRTRRDGVPIETANERIREAWGDGPIDTTQTYPWTEQQRTACRSWLRDGEIFVRMIQGRAAGYEFGPGQIPFALQYMESEYCPQNMNDYRTGRMPSSVMVRQGIAIDGWGKPLSYFFFPAHPGDIGYGTADSDYRFSAEPVFTGGGERTEMETAGVPADQVLHLKFTRRFGQLRGQTILHSVIFRMDDLKDYEDSERIAARIAASFAGFIRKSTDMPGLGSVDIDASITGERELFMEPGKIFDDLLPGEDIGTMDVNRPSNRLDSFRNSMLKAVSAGTGAKYSTLSRNYEGTYSSQRQELVEAQFSYNKLREYFCDTYLKPVYRNWLESALLSGELSLPRNADMRSAMEPNWIFPSMPWIDPLKEMQALQLAESQGYTSRTNIIVQSGQNPRKVREQRMVERQLDLALGIESDPTKKTAEQNELEGGPEQNVRIGVVNPGEKVA